jgi:dienelactone hydrolase
MATQKEGSFFYQIMNPMPAEVVSLVIAYLAHEDCPVCGGGRVLAGFEALKTRPGVDAGRIGAVRFCFGGQCLLELARSGADVKSVVSFHGLLNTSPWAPLAHVDGFRDEMIVARTDWQVTIYGEGYHAFTDPNAVDMADVPGLRYDPLLDRLS